MSGAQVSYCDVYKLKHSIDNKEVTPPDDLEAVSAPSYFDSTQSRYAVTGGHFAGGFVGNADIGSAASVGGGLSVLSVLDFENVATALSLVVTTIEHSDVEGAAGGFSAISDGTDSSGKVGKTGGFAGEISGAHIQNSHCKNFYYMIGQEAAGGYVGSMKPGEAARLLGNAGVIATLAGINGSLLSLISDFVPTIRNSTTSCVPCGGAVRAQAASDSGHQRGCAGGYCGHNEGGHIWGLNTNTWQDQNNGVVLGRNFGHDREGEYTGERHTSAAWRIRSVYGYEYAGGFTGFMEAADTAGTGNVGLLGGLVQASNLLTALSVVYPTEKNTAVYGPLRNVDTATWNAWKTYVGKYGGYGMELATQDISSPQANYFYGCNVVAGRSTVTDTVGNTTMFPASEGGDAGGYVGLVRSGVITNGQSHDMKLIRAMRSAGGYAGSLQTGGIAELGEAGITLFGLNLTADLGKLISAVKVFVPTVNSGSVTGWQTGLTVIADGVSADSNNDGLYDNDDDITYKCGYAGGYVGSAYGAQIFGDKNVGNTAGTGCNVGNLRFVRGNNAAGGYAGIVTAAAMAEVDTHTAKTGLLQGIFDAVVDNSSELASVLQVTASTVVYAQVDPDDSDFGFVVEGTGSTPPRYAGGFAGILEASFAGIRVAEISRDDEADSNIVINGLRSVDAIYYAGGFFGLADVTGVADVSHTGQTGILERLVTVGEISVIDAFRSYVYYSEVNGVSEGIVVRTHGADSRVTNIDTPNEGMLSETRYSGCAGGFGGAMMNGTVKYGKVSNLNTVYGKNYTGGFIGHMGKSGVVDADNAQVANLIGLTAGAFDIFSTHAHNCEVTGITAGAVVMSTGGGQPIAGGFVGYADVSKIKTCRVENLKQVYSDQIAGGFVGKTDMHYVVSVEADSPLVQVVEQILNLLLQGLLVDRLENIDLLSLNLGIANLSVLTDGQLAYVNLLGLKIGVTLIDKSQDGKTGTALVTIGDSSVALPFNEGGIDMSGENAEVVVNLIKGNRTHIENSYVKGISTGYDVYGGGAGNNSDGSGVNGKAGGFVGFNNEGHLLNNTMEYCDVVRGTAQMTGPFSGFTSLQSVYSFNTLQSIEGENNTYYAYRKSTLKYALTDSRRQIGGQAVEDNGYNRFAVTHLAAPIVPGENEAYYLIFQKWEDAVLASNTGGSGAVPANVYESSAKAVLMLDTPTEPNDQSLVPVPGVNKDPCDEKLKLTIQKVWQDQNNGFGARPASIKVKVWQHWYDENGVAIMDGSSQKVTLYTDATCDQNGWFTLSADEHGRRDSAAWTRVIDGLPAYTSSPDTYYTYTVEEAPIAGYSSSITYDETGSTETAKIVNTKTLEIQFKYYDRYEIDGTAAGISSTETAYSVPVNGIPSSLITLNNETQTAQSINFSSLIGSKAVEFAQNKLSVGNVMCDYDLWTSQSKAVSAMSGRSYITGGRETDYEADDVICHTDYLGRPLTEVEKWVTYYDAGDNELAETALGENYNCNKVSRIVVWCYNYPKQYDVYIYGANSSDDLLEKTVCGNTMYVADAESADNDVKWLDETDFYYNQRFGVEMGREDLDAAGFIENYGLPGYTGVQPANYTSDSFDGYSFAYWAYDQEGTQIASVERSFYYRVTTDTKLYAVYSREGTSEPGISISANSNDTYVDSSGVSRTRLNIFGSVYGAPDYDPNVQKLSFVNISLSEQIRNNPEIYTPERINALFNQYKDQLKGLIRDNDLENGSKPFSSNVTYDGDIDAETGEAVDTLQLTLTTKGYIYTVVSNGNEAASGDSTVLLTNKNRAQFTISYKTSALNINNTNAKGNTCLMYCGALKYNGEWSISTNCLIYYNGETVDNTAKSWE